MRFHDVLGVQTVDQSSLLRLVTPLQLLLQHDAIHARLEKGENKTRLSLEFAEPVQNLGCGLRRHRVDDCGELK